MIYIMRHQCKNWYKQQEISDIKKQTHDFIYYSNENLGWFALQLVLCTVPIVVILASFEKASVISKTGHSYSQAHVTLVIAIGC